MNKAARLDPMGFLEARQHYGKRIWAIFRVNLAIAVFVSIAILVLPAILKIPVLADGSVPMTLELDTEPSLAILGALLTAVISLQVVWRVSRVRSLNEIADQEQAFLVVRSFYYGMVAQTTGTSAAVVGIVSGLLNSGGPDELQFFALVSPAAIGFIVMFLAVDVAAGIDSNLERDVHKAISDSRRQAYMRTLRAELGTRPGPRQGALWTVQLVSAVLISVLFIAVVLVIVSPNIGVGIAIAAGSAGTVIVCAVAAARSIYRHYITITTKFVAGFFQLFGLFALIYMMLIVVNRLVPSGSSDLFAWLALLGGLIVVLILCALVVRVTSAKAGRFPRVFDALALLAIWAEAGRPKWREIDEAPRVASASSGL